MWEIVSWNRSTVWTSPTFFLDNNRHLVLHMFRNNCFLLLLSATAIILWFAICLSETQHQLWPWCLVTKNRKSNRKITKHWSYTNSMNVLEKIVLTSKRKITKINLYSFILLIIVGIKYFNLQLIDRDSHIAVWRQICAYYRAFADRHFSKVLLSVEKCLINKQKKLLKILNWC